MKYTFVKLATKSGRPPPVWYLKLTSREAAIERFETKEAMALAQGVWSFGQSKEFGYLLNGQYNGKDHCRGKLAHLALLKATCAVESGRKNYSLLTVAQEMEQAWIGPRLKYIEKYGAIYVNKLGGWMTLIDDMYTVVAQTESETWPEYVKSDIHVSRWPGGTHFYAKVGDQDVVVDGKEKWNTWDEAQTAADKFFAVLQA